MKNATQKQFITALNFLLKKEGHGAQARLARALKIDSGYLNAIVKGRTPGSQEKKDKIAAYFNLHYESMLSLGRWLLSGQSPGKNPQPPDIAEDWSSLVTPEKSPEQTETSFPRISEPHVIYEFSLRDKQDKNMLLIAEWINQQEEPSEYWTLLKMFLRREEPEFKEWLKKRAAGGGQDRLPENKSAVGE